jgi:ParB-like chromosome segregation protein Spo0J
MTATQTPTSSIDVREIEVNRLVPNAWNPNRMSPELMHKLRVYIEREGFVEPIVVRPKGDQFEILGGYHRWLIAKDLGYTAVPCSVVDLDDRRAKILTINLNELKGQSLPQLLAQLVHDLEAELSFEDLETQLPYSLKELKDLDQLLRIPDGLEALIDDEIERMDKERPDVMTFAVTRADIVESAIAKATAQQVGRLSRGQALVVICEAYIREAVPDAQA